MNTIDKRNKLKEKPFSFKITNSDKVIIYFKNKQIMIVKGSKSAKLSAKLYNSSEEQIQLILAKFTGNFKHGNEKLNKNNY